MTLNTAMNNRTELWHLTMHAYAGSLPLLANYLYYQRQTIWIKYESVA